MVSALSAGENGSVDLWPLLALFDPQLLDPPTAAQQPRRLWEGTVAAALKVVDQPSTRTCRSFRSALASRFACAGACATDIAACCVSLSMADTTVATETSTEGMP